MYIMTLKGKEENQFKMTFFVVCVKLLKNVREKKA